MSPNESQLRAALRDGEGRSLNVDAVVAGAVRVRRARRQRITSVAGAVVVVAGVATGGALLLGRDNGGGATGSSATYGAASGARPTSGLTRQPLSLAPTSAAAGGKIPCPAAEPRLMPPGGGGTGLFGGNGALFGRSVSVIKVCAYPSGRSVVLSGAKAHALVTSMETAPKTRVGRQCPDSTTGVSASLAVYAVDASGNPSRVVTVTLGCQGLLTNGTAVRYAWSPPPLLSSLVPSARGIPPPGAPSR